jgi:hypothetical protein
MTNHARSQFTEAHTPGPWVELGDQGETIAILPAGRPGEICAFASPRPSRADARLISAAPDLLEALLMISALVERLSWLKEGSMTRFLISPPPLPDDALVQLRDENDRLRAIIAELITELEPIAQLNQDETWTFDATWLNRVRAAINKARGEA